MRKVAPRDKRWSGRVVGEAAFARCDMMAAVLLVPVVKMWAHCLVCQDDSSCRVSVILDSL